MSNGSVKLIDAAAPVREGFVVRMSAPGIAGL